MFQTYSDDINIISATYLTTLSVTEIQRSTGKWGAFCQYRGGMGLKITFVDTRFGGFVKFFLSSQYSIIRHVSNLFR